MALTGEEHCRSTVEASKAIKIFGKTVQEVLQDSTQRPLIIVIICVQISRYPGKHILTLTITNPNPNVTLPLNLNLYRVQDMSRATPTPYSSRACAKSSRAARESPCSSSCARMLPSILTQRWPFALYCTPSPTLPLYTVCSSLYTYATDPWSVT